MGLKYKVLPLLRNSPGGLTIEEIATKLGENEHSIRTVIRRAKEIIELDEKRDRQKIYALKVNNNEYKEYLKILHGIMYDKMEPSAKLEDDDIKALMKIEEMIK